VRPGIIFAAATLLSCVPVVGAQSPGLSNELAVVPPIRDYPTARASSLKGSITLDSVLRRALTANPNVVFQGIQVLAEEGNVQQALGAYETEANLGFSREGGRRPLRKQDVDTFATAGLPETRADRINNAEYRAGVTRTLRSGAELEATATVNSTASTLSEASSTPTPRQTTAGLRFGIRIPLLRNAGGLQNATALKAREIEHDASIEDLLQTSSATVLAVVQAYWDLTARQLRAGILKESEQRASDLAAEIEKLVAADQIPGAELDLAQASTGEKRASRVAEEQALQAAWNTLGRLLQSDTVDDVLDAALKMDSLPELDQRAADFANRMQSKYRDALEKRADVRAARLREQAALIQVRAAEDTLKAQIDFVGALNTNGLAEGTSAPRFDMSRPFPTLNIGVQMRMPLESTAARGLVTTRLSAHRQALVRLQEAEGNVGSALTTAASSLRRIVRRHEDTAAAVLRYEQAVKNEYIKRKLGLATLIDVINVQDRLDNARLQLLQQRQEYASGIAQVLFDAGELVGRDAELYRIDTAILGGAGVAGRR
jgi:outer membrane protein TolC